MRPGAGGDGTPDRSHIYTYAGGSGTGGRATRLLPNPYRRLRAIPRGCPTGR
jgi:hypothetical protein